MVGLRGAARLLLTLLYLGGFGAGLVLSRSVEFGKVQGRADRRFNWARYDAEHTVDGFALRPREDPASDAAAAQLVHAVDATLQPAAVGIWLPEEPRSYGGSR